MSTLKRKVQVDNENIIQPSKGLTALHNLNFSLGIKQHKKDIDMQSSDKTIKTTTLESKRQFNPKEDTFIMSTQMVKRVCSVFEIFKDNVECNIQFSQNGINVFALYYNKTVCICTHLGRDLFSEFSCEKEIVSCVELNVFAKKISTLQRFKPQKLTFSNEGNKLVVTGYPENAAPGKAVMNSLSSSVEELDPSAFEYDVNIRVVSVEFAKLIDAMPSSFTLSMDCERKQLVFEGKEDQSSITLRLGIDEDVVTEIEKFDDVSNYKASFMKSNLQPIVKGSKLSTYAIISFRTDSPLFVRYIINESDTPDNNSKICMYFSSKFDDEFE